MAVPITTTHAFVSAKADGGDTTLVRPSNWNAAHKGTTSVVNAATDYGAVGDGVTDDTTALQNAAVAAGTQYPLYIPPATYLVTGTITVQGDLYARGATFTTTSTTLSPLLLLRTGSGVTRYQHRVAWTPIINTTGKVVGSGTWNTDIGVQVVNGDNSEIHFGAVSNFGTGILINAQGAIGTSYCQFFLGQLSNNKINLKLSNLADNASWVNEDIFYGGNFTHTSSEGSLLANTAHIFIDSNAGGNQPNNNRFISPSFEGVVRLWDVDCMGTNIVFEWARWESGAGGILPKVQFRAANAARPAVKNQIIGGYNSELIAFTEDVNSKYNKVLDTVGLRINGTGGAQFGAQNAFGETNNAIVVYAAGDSLLGKLPEVDFRIGLSAGASLHKRTTDTKANYRFGFDHDNGVLNWGGGAGIPDTNLYRNAAAWLSTDSLLGAKQLTGVTAGGVEFFRIGNGFVGLSWGSGAPTLSAGKGSLYLRTDATTNVTRLYTNTDGGTTWTAINTVA